MQLLRDNLTLWTSDLQNEQQAAAAGGDDKPAAAAEAPKAE